MQALAGHVSASLAQRSVQQPDPAEAADGDAVKRTLRGLIADIIGFAPADSEPLMEVFVLSEFPFACSKT